MLESSHFVRRKEESLVTQRASSITTLVTLVYHTFFYIYLTVKVHLSIATADWLHGRIWRIRRVSLDIFGVPVPPPIWLPSMAQNDWPHKMWLQVVAMKNGSMGVDTQVLNPPKRLQLLGRQQCASHGNLHLTILNQSSNGQKLRRFFLKANFRKHKNTWGISKTVRFKAMCSGLSSRRNFTDVAFLGTFGCFRASSKADPNPSRPKPSPHDHTSMWRTYGSWLRSKCQHSIHAEKQLEIRAVFDLLFFPRPFCALTKS